MAKLKATPLKATPKNFAEAVAVLAGRDSIRLGNNTYLEKFVSDRLKIVVRLHRTNIVVFHDGGRVTLYTGGYRTVTTKEWINQFIVGRLYQDAGMWAIRYADGAVVPFVEGNDVRTA